MKLRLRGHTLRLRLLKDEVERLSLGQTIEESLPTPNPFIYAILPGNVDAVELDHANGRLTAIVPTSWASNWFTSDEVGIEAQCGAVSVLIEKDWACTTPRTTPRTASTESDEGTYPNPTR
jgi:hypothetical protein